MTTEPTTNLPTTEATAPGARPASFRENGMATLQQLKRWHREGVNHFLEYRDDAEDEEGIVFGYQWDADEEAKIRKDKRIPLTFNHTQKNVLAMYGYRASNKYEPKYLPKEGSDADEAEILTHLAKHFWDSPDNATEFEWGKATFQQYIGPFGCIFAGYQYDDPEAEHIKFESIDWREMRNDPISKRADRLDARFQARERWEAIESLVARFPEHEAKIREYAVHARSREGQEQTIVDHGGDPYDDKNTTPIAYLNERQECRTVEMWYRTRKRGLLIKTETGWEAFDPKSVDHQMQALMGGPAVVRPGMVHCVYYATFMGDVILEEGKSPYTHKFFPYVMIWGLVDNKSLPHGAVRALKDVQRLINWTRAKKQWLANANQYLVPKASVQDMQAFAKNAARPDGIMEYQGDRPPQRVDQSQGITLNQSLERDAINDMKEIGGAPDELRGQQSNADSGVAIQSRIEAALRQQGIFLDNEKRAMLQLGQMLRSMIFDSVTGEKIIRLTQPSGQVTFAAVNVEDPLRREQLKAKGYKVFGSVTRGHYDTAVVISPQSTTVRQAQAQEQDALAKSLPPEMFAAIADLWIEGKDVAHKDKMSERIRALLAPPPMPGPGMPGAPMPLPPGVPPMGPPPMPEAPPEMMMGGPFA